MTATLTSLILIQRVLGSWWERIGGTGPVAGLTLIVTALAICGLSGLVR